MLFKPVFETLASQYTRPIFFLEDSSPQLLDTGHSQFLFQEDQKKLFSHKHADFQFKTAESTPKKAFTSFNDKLQGK